MRKKIYTGILALTFGISVVHSQCPSIDVTIDPTLCIDEVISIYNNTDNSLNFEWDFCSGSIENDGFLQFSETISEFSNAFDIDHVYDNVTGYHTFFVNRTNGSIVRIDYANEINDQYTVTDLGNLTGLITDTGGTPLGPISDPQGITIVQEAGNWYGIVSTIDGNFIKLSFGNDILATPTGVNYGQLAGVANFGQIEILQLDGETLAFSPGGGNTDSKLLLMDFGSSIENTPLITVHDIAGGNTLFGLSLINDCTNWYGLLAGFGSGLMLLEFGNAVKSAPIVSPIPGVSNPRGVKMLKDAENYYGLLATQTNSKLYRLNFGSAINDNPDIDDLGDFSVLNTAIAFDAQQDSSVFRVYAAGFTNKAFSVIEFEKNCDIDTYFSSEFQPSDISYNASGSFMTTVKAYSNRNFQSSNTFNLTISAEVAPDISFSTQNICVNNSVDFVSLNTSGDITSYNWDFGDTNTSTIQDPSNTYLTSDTYNVDLIVQNTGGCTSSASQSITIYDQPVASFDLPINSICTNLDNTFTNTTIDNFDGNLTYEWKVDGVTESTNRDFIRAFASSGNSNINLIASISGCSSSSTQNIEIFDGPLVAFQLSNNCLGESTPFTNQTTGNNITDYSWDFGDGAGISIETNPNYTYVDNGTYSVKLDATNIEGCITSAIQDISVYRAAPTPTFSFSESTFCTNLEVAYTDDSDEIGFTPDELNYIWDFDGEQGSTQKDTVYTFTTSGTKNISLNIITVDNCVAITNQNIDVIESPEAVFQISNNCLGESTPFNNQTTDDNIASYSWDFGDASGTSNDVNPNYTYLNDGTYSVRLDATNIEGCLTSTTQDIVVYSLPEVNFNYEVGCEGREVFFTDGSTAEGTNVISWDWNFSNLVTSTEENPSFLFTDPGNYNVNLSATTTLGCSNSTDQSIMIIANLLPTISVTSDSDACIGEIISFNNNSDNSLTYEWDFCSGSIENDGFLKFNKAVPEFNDVFGLDHVYDDLTGHHTFFVNRSNGSIIRIDYDNEINDQYTVTDLGNLSGLIASPQGISIIEEQSNWYGIISTLGGNFIRLSFGSDILATPIGENLGVLSEVANFGQIEILQLDGETLAFSPGGGNSDSKLLLMDFGSSIENTPLITVHDIAGGNTLFGLALIHECTNWYGLLAGLNSGLMLLEFGSDLKSVPIVSPIPGVSNPRGVKMLKDAENYYGLLTTQTSSKLYRLNFGSTINDNPDIDDLGDFSVLNTAIGFDAQQDSSVFRVYTAGFTNNAFSVIEFEKNCDIDTYFSSEFQPSDISYNASGIFMTTVKAYSNRNFQSSNTFNLTISAEVAPDISFNSQNICTNNPIDFTTANSSGDITNYSWNFGDTNSSTIQDPSHTYFTSDTYNVDLTVQNTGGCTSSASQSITVYDPPIASFDLPSSAICTNFDNNFTNTTTDNFDNNLTYEWQVEGLTESTSRDFTRAFGSNGNFDINLITSIPGCSNNSNQNIEVFDDPSVAFQLSDNCEGETTPFMNQTTGDNITNYAWDFGDAVGTSNDLDPTYLYPTNGNYSVELTATNAAGCVTSSNQEITIFRAAPIPDFSLSETTHCTDLEVIYTNNSDETGFTPEELTYNWDFATENTSNQRDTVYTFTTPGMKNISLNITTVDNCEATTIQNLDVIESPSTAFILSDNCQGLNTTFTDQTTGENISSYSWSFGDGIGTSNDLGSTSYLYPNDGIYSVNLLATNTSGCETSVSQDITIFRAAPTPDFSLSETTHCTDLEVIYTNNSDESDFISDELTYTWDFASENTSNQRNTVYTFTTPGTKDISLNITTIDNCVATTVQNIDVIESPETNFSVSNNCLEQVTFFSNETSGENLDSYLWDFGDDITNTLSDPSHVYNSAGTYDVALTSTNTSGCQTTSINTVTIHSLPVVSFTHEVGCEGQPVTFQDATTVENANIESWNWDFDGLDDASEKDPSYTFNSTGTFDVTLTATTNFDCSSVATQSVTINPSPITDFDIEVGCLNEITSFRDRTMTVDENPVESWLWEVNGETRTDKDIDYTFFSTGIYDISLTVTSQNDCSVIKQKQITIDALPEVGFSVQSACENQFVVFQDTSISTASTIISRVWDFDGKGTANGIESTFDFDNSGNYNVSLSVMTESGCTNNIVQQVEVQAAPIAQFTPSTDFGPPPLDVTFDNTTSGNNSYFWLFGDSNTSNSMEPGPTFIFNDLGNYNVQLIAENSFGCTDTVSTQISVVVPDMNLTLTNIESQLNNENIRISLTVSNDGTIDVNGFKVNIGIENETSLVENYTEVLKAKASVTFALAFEIPASTSNISFVCFSIEDKDPDNMDSDLSGNEGCINFEQELFIENPFPNPTTDNISINMVLPSDASIQIGLINAYGKVVYNEIFSDIANGLNNFNVDTRNFKKGIYFLKIVHNGKETIRRIVKL